MVRCSIHAQIYARRGKDIVILLSPQWGSNSKVDFLADMNAFKAFQSPQWGSNSKGEQDDLYWCDIEFQSPQWGSNSKDAEYTDTQGVKFQSPQWGSNSKGSYLQIQRS